MRYIDNALSKGEQYKRNYISCDSVVKKIDSMYVSEVKKRAYWQQMYDEKPKEVTKVDWLTVTLAVVVIETINILLLILIK